MKRLHFKQAGKQLIHILSHSIYCHLQKKIQPNELGNCSKLATAIFIFSGTLHPKLHITIKTAT